MKSVLLVAALLGFAGVSGAQNAPPTTENIVYGSVRYVDGVFQMRDLQIRVTGAEIRADEASMSRETREFELRGNVRMVLTGQNPTR